MNANKTNSSGFPQITQDWGVFRDQMPVTQKWAYFDHAAVAPLPRPAHQAIQTWMDESLYDGDTAWPRWVSRLEQGRQTAARMINAQTEEIAWVANTTTGIGLVAEGLHWRPGENAVILTNEFPSNQYPWLNLASRGVETRRVEVGPHGQVDLTRLLAAIDSKTRIVAVSWVGYATGWRLDLDAVTEAVHSRGCRILVDAIQGLGVFPLDVCKTPIDFLAADGHKWLLGPEGAGLLFVRRERLEELRPLMVGWNSVVQGNDFSKIELNFRDSAARYEGGSQNLVGGLGLSASLAMPESSGVGPQESAVGRRVLEVTEMACEELRRAGAEIVSERAVEHASGIVAFDWPSGDPQEIRKRLIANQVVLSCRGGHLRISPHAYNDDSDLDRLIGVLKMS